MEGRKIANKNIHAEEIDIDNQETLTEFLEIINNERQRYQKHILLKTLGCFFLYSIFLGIYWGMDIVFEQNLFLSVWINWIVVVLLFLVLYLIFRTNTKLSPTFLEYIRESLKELELQVKRRKQYIYYYIVANTISVTLMGVIFLFKISFPLYIYPFLVGFFLLCLITPFAIGAKKDKYYVHLKREYEIEFNFRGKTLKINDKKRLTVGVHMISNHLCYKWEEDKGRLLKEISTDHWLPRKGRRQLVPVSPYLYLFEYATVLNFEHRFLNLALAIREWDKRKN